MNKQTFILRSEKVRANLMAEIARLRIDEPLEVTIRPYRKSRSLEQNSLYHAWIGIIASELGYDHDDMHEAVKMKFLPPVLVEIAGEVHEVRRSTTKLKVDEMSAYMDAVHAWATGELGIRLPLPEERSAA